MPLQHKWGLDCVGELDLNSMMVWTKADLRFQKSLCKDFLVFQNTHQFHKLGRAESLSRLSLMLEGLCAAITTDIAVSLVDSLALPFVPILHEALCNSSAPLQFCNFVAGLKELTVPQCHFRGGLDVDIIFVCLFCVGAVLQQFLGLLPCVVVLYDTHCILKILTCCTSLVIFLSFCPGTEFHTWLIWSALGQWYDGDFVFWRDQEFICFIRVTQQLIPGSWHGSSFSVFESEKWSIAKSASPYSAGCICAASSFLTYFVNITKEPTCSELCCYGFFDSDAGSVTRPLCPSHCGWDNLALW